MMFVRHKDVVDLGFDCVRLRKILRISIAASVSFFGPPVRNFTSFSLYTARIYNCCAEFTTAVSSA
jgi:hypothetical protein